MKGNTLKGCYVAAPLKWNTLEEAVVWLSDKTKENWTPRRIIDFAIDQCRPDDIVEDYKYPTYLRTIYPKNISDYLLWVSLRLEDYSATYVSEGIQLKDKEIKTTFVFKDNLIKLISTGKTGISYISYHDLDQPISERINKSLDHGIEPITVYCELRPMILSVDEPYPKFPVIPIIQIDFETLGIRDEELKQLLHDYLALPKKKPAKKDTKLSVTRRDKAAFQGIAAALWERNPNLTQAAIINHVEMEFYRATYTGKNTLSDWLREIDSRPKDSRRGAPKKHPST